MHNDLRAHTRDGGDFPRIGAFRHDDAGRNTKEPGSVRDGLAMVAGGGGNHATLAILVGELREIVDSPADFEGSDWLIVLVFDMNREAKERIQRRIAVERCAREIGANVAPGAQNIVEGDRLHVCLLICRLRRVGRGCAARTQPIKQSRCASAPLAQQASFDS